MRRGYFSHISTKFRINFSIIATATEMHIYLRRPPNLVIELLPKESHAVYCIAF